MYKRKQCFWVHHRVCTVNDVHVSGNFMCACVWYSNVSSSWYSTVSSSYIVCFVRVRGSKRSTLSRDYCFTRGWPAALHAIGIALQHARSQGLLACREHF